MNYLARYFKLTFVKKIKLSILITFFSLSSYAAFNDGELIDAIKNGETTIGFRYRYEQVAERLKSCSYANTLRSRLIYQTDNYKGLKVTFGFSNVTGLGEQKFNSGGGTSPSKLRYAIIADPNNTAVYQANVNYTTLFDTNIIFGRQIINLDNQRFIGEVAFRQTSQTYDAITVKNSYLSKTEVLYSHIYRVNRIFSNAAIKPFDDNRNNTNLLNIKYGGFDYVDLIGYFYSIKNKDIPMFSTNTIGARAVGDKKFKSLYDLKFLYEAEYAYQKNTFNNPVSFSGYYTNLTVGAEIFRTIVKIGREELSGDRKTSGKSFRTPLATLHIFQGWNDLFLTTPAAGIEDLFVSFSSIIKPLFDTKITIIYHDFKASDGDSKLGEEINLNLSKKINKLSSVSVQYGKFHSHNILFQNNKKFWLTARMDF
ncbi:MAG: alginate export family protein [Rickettsiaceae bacterium]|nr:alginate export family protein [Rickettsiaceae bacterium]